MDFKGQSVEIWMDSTDLVQSLTLVFCDNNNKLCQWR